MKRLLALLLTSTLAHAEDLPKQFEYQYDKTTKIVLLNDEPCDPANLSLGNKAYALNTDTNDKAEGCYISSDDTYLILMVIGNKKYLDYQFYKTRFTPVY